ncbi:MAG: DUF2470 domain-containing protein [Solirubrobacterales bacterium]|nr:DUF2470 domain-containing protein [Solirubrobacterales bacterium]
MTTETEMPRNVKEVVGPHDISEANQVPVWAALARNGTRRSPAEEARTILDQAASGTLGTISEDGTPWASLVTYGLLDDGSPVLCLSIMAEHGRNAERERQASLMVADPHHGGAPLAGGRVTLAGRLRRPEEHPLGETAREAHLGAVPAAEMYIDYRDFSLWILEVERVRWVGGYGRMDSAGPEDYAAAAADPVAPQIPHAISHLNEDHAENLVEIARGLGPHADAEMVKCVWIDRYGLDLEMTTAEGPKSTRVDFSEPVTDPDGLRAATVELVGRAREALAD